MFIQIRASSEVCHKITNILCFPEEAREKQVEFKVTKILLFLDMKKKTNKKTPEDYEKLQTLNKSRMMMVIIVLVARRSTK